MDTARCASRDIFIGSIVKYKTFMATRSCIVPPMCQDEKRKGKLQIDGPPPANDMTTAANRIDWACGFEASGYGVGSCSDCTDSRSHQMCRCAIITRLFHATRRFLSSRGHRGVRFAAGWLHVHLSISTSSRHVYLAGGPDLVKHCNKDIMHMLDAE
jgi:hypothetical protein